MANFMHQFGNSMSSVHQTISSQQCPDLKGTSPTPKMPSCGSSTELFLECDGEFYASVWQQHEFCPSDHFFSAVPRSEGNLPHPQNALVWEQHRTLFRV